MNSIMVSKNAVDYLIEGVIENNEIKIHDSVGQIYAELFEKNMDDEFIRMNMDYLLMRLAYMATEQDDSVNQ
ncbi:MAG: two-component system response regulator, partial [Lachnospiraceae bacterium]|nr:two-component system response regulator [Lachnospiraceae bacterium]